MLGLYLCHVKNEDFWCMCGQACVLAFCLCFFPDPNPSPVVVTVVWPQDQSVSLSDKHLRNFLKIALHSLCVGVWYQTQLVKIHQPRSYLMEYRWKYWKTKLGLLKSQQMEPKPVNMAQVCLILTNGGKATFYLLISMCLYCTITSV